MKLGIISDTHDYFDSRIGTHFAGVDHILHAGDIGRPGILLQLEQIAPVTAVGGNTDDPGFRYPETEIVQLAGRKLLIHHIVAPHQLTEQLQSRITRERPEVVVFGHTHKPFSEWLNGMLFFNPGYAGKSRFGMERSVALMYFDQQGVRWEYCPL